MSRDSLGRFKPGTSGNPRGTPRSVLDLGRAIRRGVDPDELVQLALTLLRDDRVPARDRIAMWAQLASRGWVSPPSTSAVQVSATVSTLPEDWSRMTPAARSAYLDAFVIQRAALPTGDDDPNDYAELSNDVSQDDVSQDETSMETHGHTNRRSGE